MNRKFTYRCWIGTMTVLLGIGLCGILKHVYCGKYGCKSKFNHVASNHVGNNAKVQIKKYEFHSSPEVLNALEKKEKNPLKVEKQEFKGLSLAPILGAERIILRGIEERDWDDLANIFSDYYTIYMLAFMPWPFDRNHTLIYMKNLSWNMSRGNSLYWAIALPEEDRLIGVIGLTLEHEHDRAELHFWLSKDHRNRGYMTEAARRIVDYVFRDLGLNRLDVNHLTINIGSQRVIEKCGFKFECEKDEFAKKEGKYENMKYHRLLRSEYLNEN